MFYAYSKKNNDSIHINDVTDFSDTFKCLNENCNAEFTACAINSDRRSAYFMRRKSTPHIKGCVYDLDSNRYVDRGDIIKSNIEDIYMGSTSKRTTSSKKTLSVKGKNNSSFSSSQIYVRTPKQLLQYCISNDLQTNYTSDLTIGDIFLDERNISQNANFKGVTGVRMILGKTIRYDLMNSYFEMSVSSTTKNGIRLLLTARIYLDNDQLIEIKKYILNTFDNKFANHQIAVLGDWQITKKYNIKCNIESFLSSNIVYKFIH